MDATKLRFFEKKDRIWIALIFLYSINFMDLGWYMPLLLLPTIIVFMLRNKFSISFVYTIMVLLLFNLVYLIFVYVYGYSTMDSILGKFIYPLLFFIIGDMLARGDHQYRKTYGFLLLLIVSNTLFGLLCVFKTISVFGSINATQTQVGRIVVNVWRDNIIASTIINMSFAFGLSLLSFLFLSKNAEHRGKFIKRVCLTCFFISTYCVIQLGNRTGVIIVVASFIVTLFLRERIGFKKIIRLLSVAILALFSKFIYDINTLGIKSYWEGTYIYTRFNPSSLTEDPRVETWRKAFWGMFENPFGGRLTSMPLRSGHNLWLDVGFEAGIIPFVILVIFTIISIKSLLTFIRLDTPIMLKSIVLGLYTSFLVTFIMEPVLLGGVAYFTMFCFVFGMIQRINFEIRTSSAPNGNINSIVVR